MTGMRSQMFHILMLALLLEQLLMCGYRSRITQSEFKWALTLIQSVLHPHWIATLHIYSMQCKDTNGSCKKNDQKQCQLKVQCLFKKKQICDDIMTMCSTLVRPLDHWSSEQMSACTALLILLSPQMHTFCSRPLVPTLYFYILFFLSPCSLFILFTPHHNHFSFHFPHVKTNTPPRSLHTLLHLFLFKIRLPVPVPVPPAGVPWVSSSDRCSPVCSPACSSGFGVSPTREPEPL